MSNIVIAVILSPVDVSIVLIAAEFNAAISTLLISTDMVACSYK